MPKKSAKNNKEKEIEKRPTASGIEDRSISTELQESYLDYAMSVIVSRALPDVRDGLKPVHRRILWGMWEAGITAGAKTRKSAYVVGEVMGKYHPHGDAAIYDTLTRMAQDFSLRYPFVDGQGNFGSIDGDNAAAMRYTEARLSKVAEEMLTDIEKETVDWAPNYDGTRQEPKVLPAKLPNLLLNGAVGIAVGMATNVPPHNLGEVTDATLHLIDNPKATSGDLLNFIQGPDFPTGGIIYDKKAIAEAYIQGHGAITMRANAEIKEKKGSSGRGDFFIEVTEIPYQVNKAELIIKIAELVTSKKLEGIRDVRDESDKDGLSIVIELKSGVPPQKVLNQLYQYTDLQKDFHLNMIALAGGIQPELMSLKDVLEAYIDHRKEVVKRRAQFDLRKAEERAHILMGLSKALSSIDQVIETIKKSSDREDAKQNLIKRFKFSDLQANAILEMRLQTLANLERQKIEDELKEKRKLIADLQLLLKSPAKILKVVKDELLEVKQKYGDGRRTKVIASGLKEFREEDLIPAEETIITLSQSGYIKRVPPASFKSQKRGGKGLIGSEVNEEDFLSHFISANTHDNILFFTDRGRAFQTKVYDIPQGTRVSKGKPIHNFLEIPAEEKVTALVTYKKASDGNLVMVTRNGAVKKTPLEDFGNVRRTGIIAIKLRKGDRLNWVQLSTGKDEIIITTAKGQAIRFRESQARPMGRATAGVRAIRLRSGDEVASMDILPGEKTKDKNLKLLAVMANGYGKQTPLAQYKVQGRGGSGILTAKITSKTGQLVAASLIDQEEELLALSAKGQIIRTKIAQIRTASRATQGVRIMTLKPGDKVIGIVCL
ncbi:MAG: DNA gyrase subunit A [Candidatus Harrisonbacteria bacterium]|nr:DNA gyrase subunit A [Candidatus Harrisonbacteria bacterium]